MVGAERKSETVLEVKDLQTYFYTRWGVVKAVDGVSFQLRRGETLGIVGESGCGKSVTALSLVRLVPEPAGQIVGGEILLEGEDLLRKSGSEMRQLRGRKISMILQDPLTSLNPVYTVGNQLREAFKTKEAKGGNGVKRRAVEILRRVKIPAPEQRMADYPHQMSGGMRQRVSGAIALAGDPVVLIADEPTTSLDVTIQLQYLQLLRELQEESGLSIIFITHDLGIVARMCDRMIVMYAGKIVETGSVRDIFNRPSHPYTQALLKSIPTVDQKEEDLYFIPGQPPFMHRLPPGCSFAPRCPQATDRCLEEYPPVFHVEEAHETRCWRLADD